MSELAIPRTAISLLHATAFQVGLLAALGYLPLAVLGLPAGAWVDRVRRRSVLVSTDIARALVLASVPVASLLWGLTIAQLDVVALLAGSLTVFFDVAYPSYVPTLVERADLPWANSRLQVSEQGAAVLGPGVAGLLIGVVGAPLAVAADALSYLGSATFMRTIGRREPPGGGRSQRPPMRRQTVDGLRFVLGDRHLRAIAMTSGLANLFGRMVVVVALIYLVRAGGYPATAIGVVFAVGGVGFLVGAAMADRVIERIGLGRAIVAGGSVASLPWILVALPPARGAGPFVAAAFFVYGLGALTFTVGNATLRQLTAPPELLGRVTSSMRLLVWIAQPLAAIAGGWLASGFGLHAALWIGALAALMSPIPLYAWGVSSARIEDSAGVAATS